MAQEPEYRTRASLSGTWFKSPLRACVPSVGARAEFKTEKKAVIAVKDVPVSILSDVSARSRSYFVPTGKTKLLF